MKKTFLTLVLFLLAAMLVMTGCVSQQNNTIPTVTQANALLTPVPVPEEDLSLLDLPEGYDPASEEDHNPSLYLNGAYDEYGGLSQVGATPVPLDPIDLPTPTPRPELVFTYTAYTAASLGISFEAPAGWVVDESVPGTITLYDTVVRDGYQGYITISVTNVASSYRKADLKSQLSLSVADLHRTNFDKWEDFDTKERTLLKKDGYYTTYRGERSDGVIIRGYMQVALLDNNRVITLHVSAPGWYNSSYGNVYHKVRDTMKTK